MRPLPLPGVRPLLALALRAWPAERRRAHGAPLLETAEALLADAARAGRWRLFRAAAGEAAALVREGLALRAADAALRARAAAGEWGFELRLAVRALRRTPGVTVAVVATLALGLGANSAVFGLADGVLFARPPYAEPRELLLVWNTLPGADERIPVAGPDAHALRERARRLSAVTFTTRTTDGAVEAEAGDAWEHVRVAEVEPGFFEVLGVAPALGRGFSRGEGGGTAGGPASGAASVAVLADAAWRRIFGADPGVVGRTILLNGVPVVVVGVMPRSFRLVLPPDAGVGTDVDVWAPLAGSLASFHRVERLLDQDSDNTGAVIARLAPDATVALAREEVQRIGAELRAEVPAYAAAGLGLDARPLHADATAHVRGAFVALLAAAWVVLVVACLNAAGLLVARGATRSAELSVRAALGAGRGRILRQLLAESVVLVVLGLAAALLVARAAAALLAREVPAALGVLDAPEPSLPGAAFGAAAALVALTLAGLLPARRVASLEGRGLASSALRPGSDGSGRVRRFLVVGQVALSFVLLLAAGLLLRSVRALEEVRPGFEPRGALAFELSVRVADRYRGPAERAALMKAVETRIETLPGVHAVGWVGVLPLGGKRWTQPWGLPGEPPEAWGFNRADFRVASSGWFDAVGARLLEGRGFTSAEDVTEDERVVVVDETLARRIAPAGSAVGAVLGVPIDGAPVQARVVGVVEAVRYESLEAAGREAIYVPYRQEASREVAFVVRAEGDPSLLAPAVRVAVREVDPRLPVYRLRTLEAYVAEAVAPRRFALALLVLFAALALACSGIGLYGAVAFDVTRRTRDIGVRMAVGASPGRTVREVLGSGLGLAGLGAALGALLSLAAARALEPLLFGVGAADLPAWLGVVALVTAVTLVACWLPARRASHLDPTEALRGG